MTRSTQIDRVFCEKNKHLSWQQRPQFIPPAPVQSTRRDAVAGGEGRIIPRWLCF